MKAIILAAGKWTRLKPLTNTTPKPLIKILGKSILEYNLESIYEYVDEIIIVVKYLKEKIIEEIGNTYKWVPVRYHEQGEEAGTGAALKGVKSNDDIFILYGDGILDKQDIKQVVESEYYGCLWKKVTTPEKYGIYEIDENGFARKMTEKPSEYIGDLANIWSFKVSPLFLRYIKITPLSKRWEYELVEALNKFISEENFKVIEASWNFIDISTPDDILQANKSLLCSQFRSPILWDFYPLEKFEDYTIWIWIPDSQIDAIIKYSTDTWDHALMENTSDSKRFPNIEKLTSWYYDKWRIVVSMVSSTWKIAWFWQGRPSKAPIIETITNSSLYTELERNTNNIHTSGIRIYPAFRGKWLAWPLLKLSHLYYQKIYPHFYMSIDIDTNNIASQKSFEKLWYQSVWYWENQKTVEVNKRPRIVYVYKNNPS